MMGGGGGGGTTSLKSPGQIGLMLADTVDHEFEESEPKDSRSWAQHAASICMEPHFFVLVAYSLKPVKHFGPYKRTQHCWSTTCNIVWPNILRPFAWNHNMLALVGIRCI